MAKFLIPNYVNKYLFKIKTNIQTKNLFKIFKHFTKAL